MGISKPSGGDIPEPFNENDVLVFNAYISKFLCGADIFVRQAFLNTLIEKGFKGHIDGIKEALDELDAPVNHLIHHCLKLLTNMHLTNAIRSDNGETIYMATARLKALCPRIQQYDMPFVEGLVKELTTIENEIQKDKSCDAITDLLGKLNARKQISKQEMTLNNDTLSKLIQLGVINISLNNMISLSNIGKILII